MAEIYQNYTELTLPLLPLRGIVGFPGVQLNIDIARPSSLKAFSEAATSHDAKIFLFAQKDIAKEAPEEKDLYKIGILAEIKHVVKNPQGALAVIFEGIARAKLEECTVENGHLVAKALVKNEAKSHAPSPTADALLFKVKNHINDLKDIHPTFTEEMALAAAAITNPGYFADFVA